MNRWKMHKLGFVNFWLYDHEEFPLRDGHILLRGDNASGKSITTQSFIPFLLDGNKSPERLDPFGSRDRKMDFYLLGEGEQEESTGYLYLELKKAHTEEYLTISEFPIPLVASTRCHESCGGLQEDNSEAEYIRWLLNSDAVCSRVKHCFWRAVGPRALHSALVLPNPHQCSKIGQFKVISINQNIRR